LHYQIYSKKKVRAKHPYHRKMDSGIYE